MDFHLLRDVREEEGGKLGELRHVIYDSPSRQVKALIVQHTGFSGSAVVVPFDVVMRSDEDATYIKLSAQEFDRLEKYAYGQNTAPPPAEYDPSTKAEDFAQELMDVPNVPPVGAAEGITSIAFTPVMDVWLNVPEGSLVIDDATAVTAQDGDIGQVRHVLTDEQGVLEGFVAEKGLFFTTDVEIRLPWVQEVTSGKVVLNLSKAEVAAGQSPS